MSMTKTLLLLFAFCILSFQKRDANWFEFAYPKVAGTGLRFSANHYKKFTKEWRGQDYYYFAEADGFICSVLYYKLNDEEKRSLVEAPKAAIGGPDVSPAYPYAYFKNTSNLKSMEQNDSSWGKATDDFMFRQNNIVIKGTAFSQKNMYGYGMFGNDLFVNIHLSKAVYTPSDSTEMMQLLQSLTKQK